MPDFVASLLARAAPDGAAPVGAIQPRPRSRYERAGHAMPGAVPDHHRVAVIDRLEPKEVAADDVARLPDEKVVAGDLVELAPGRQNRGLDAAGIAQALQDQLIGGGIP